MTVPNEAFSAPGRPGVAWPPEGLTLPRREIAADKFACGRVLVVGGSIGMAGAPALSAMAALRSGAGLVELHVPRTVTAIAASFSPCVMTRGGEATDEGTFTASVAGELLERGHRADCLACGPGLGRSDETRRLAWQLWREFPRTAVFDADALWAIAHLDRERLARHEGPRVLTPHAGEMLRFLTCGEDPSRGGSRRDAAPREKLEHDAAAMASAIDAVVVLKGQGSLVTDGSRRWHNTTGNPGRATAGSGDVLTGVIAAVAAAGLHPFEAARLGTWVHGHAGDLAAADRGQIGMIATDLIEALPAAFMALERPTSECRLPSAPSA
jgi:ADP-dependent NAD(P)H-hydrate dehydratase